MHCLIWAYCNPQSKLCHGAQVPDWCEPEWRGLMEACWEVNPAARPAFRDLAGHLEKIIEAAA